LLDVWGLEPDAGNLEWKAVRDVEQPAEEDYYEVLRKGITQDSRQERTLRILAWWRRNDAFREVSGSTGGHAAPASANCRTNLEALRTLLDETQESDRLMKAEVLRELGEFDAALGMLSTIASNDYEAIVGQMRSLCEAGDVGVRVIPSRR